MRCYHKIKWFYEVLQCYYIWQYSDAIASDKETQETSGEQ